MQKLVVFVVPFLLFVIPITESTTSNEIRNLQESAINNKDGLKYDDPQSAKDFSLATTQQPKQQHENKDWMLSVLNDVIKRQNERRFFHENYVSKDQVEKMRTMDFKERMDKEEIVHLKHETTQLQEIANSFQHPESSSHSISKRQTVLNRTVTPASCSTSGNCIIGKFCPYPDRPINAPDFVSFVVQKHVPSSAKTQVRFEEVLLNLGGAFNLKENVFIAPKSGIYEFNFDGHKTGTSEFLNISLRLNGKDAVNAFSDFMEQHTFRNLISMHSLLKLKKGDRVDLYVKQGNLLDDAIDGNNNVVQHTQFTEKLLLEDVPYKRLTTPVYFNVQKNVGYCEPQSSIPFEIVNINEGEAFDLKNQKFISPIAGIYEFIVKGFKTGEKDGDNNDELNLSMRLNGTPVANSWADYINNCYYKHNFHSSFSITSILKLEEGDQIDLFLAKGCLYDDTNHLTQFTGKLLMENKSDKKGRLAKYFNVQKNALFSTANAVIPFEVSVFNIGGAFSSTEHFFRAPSSGIYEFNVAGIKDDPKNILRIALRLNGKPVAFMWADYVQNHGLYTSFFLHHVMKVKEGDRIDLFNVGEKSMLFDDQRKSTHFTGKLLFETE